MMRFFAICIAVPQQHIGKTLNSQSSERMRIWVHVCVWVYVHVNMYLCMRIFQRTNILGTIILVNNTVQNSPLVRC